MTKKLALILILAAILRFWKLDSTPALNADEAAIGYNAYSLIQTGKDEHGNSWPIHFQSFNDYKPGLYVYMVIPFVKVLGLNEAAVRIPGATLGVVTVALIYWLGNIIVPRRRKVFGHDYSVGDLAALFLAISPWHIHFSRGGWETNVATFFIALGLVSFFIALKRPKALVITGATFVLAMYTYHSARVVVPLLGFALALIYRKELLRCRKWVGLTLLCVSLFITPLVIDLVGPAGVSRAVGVGLFADRGPISRINELRGEDLNTVRGKLLHNKVIGYSLVFLSNWSSHYWGEFLFLSGDTIQRNKVPETGQLYLYNLVLIGLGVWYAMNKRSRGLGTMTAWILIAPIPAALTFQSPHALRAQNLVVPITFFAAVGAYVLLDKLGTIKSRLVRTALFIVVGCVVLSSFARYEHMYWVHMSKEYPYSSQYGVKELADYVMANQDDYDTIVITDRYDQPYIQFLFYLKYPPAQFQSEHTLTSPDGFGFSTVRSFGKYRFTSIKFDEMKPEYPRSLLIGTPQEIPDAANIVSTVKFPNGEEAFRIVAN